ncbi:MAG: lipoyl(octanoyl) transferase LipB [Candidatus Omnitrophota bacterium]
MRVVRWGMIDYEDALQRQKKLVAEVAGGAPSVLVLCEHPATITLGRKASEANIFLSRQDLRQKGILCLSVDRGGDVTLHAPGQLIAYPIIDLKVFGRDIKMCLQKMEQASVDFLNDFGIVARCQAGASYRGVWVGPYKIASMGIGISRWITYHGIGLNITTDLALFQLIRPCGMNVRMTSLQELTGHYLPMDEAANNFADHFVRVFNGKNNSS